MRVLGSIPGTMATVRELWVLCLALIGVALACSSAADVPTARLHNPQNVISDVSQVVDLMKGQCPSSAGRVQLDLVQGDAHLRHVFSCSIVRGNASTAQAEVLNLVA